MRRLALTLLVLGLTFSGCSSSDSSGTGSQATWPPKATVHFDENRIFHADCETDEDCAMALAYYHAFDRFVQMDIRRRFSTGRLADILSKDLAGLFADDFADLRALFSTREGQPAEEFMYEQASDKTKALLEAYAVGVNKWIEDMQNGVNGATFPREFEHPALDYSPDRVPAWRPQDSVAAILALADNLTNDESSHIKGAEAREAIDNDAKFSDLWSRRPLENSAILPLDWAPPSPTAALVGKSSKALASRPATLRKRAAGVVRKLDEKLERLTGLRGMLLGPKVGADEIGSNNWVVSPSLTSGGNALLSNDPHLGMSQPATWYVAHIDAVTNGSGEIHGAGMTFAGLPWILVGQNEGIAWGLTTTYMDFSDVYVETLVKDSSGNPTGVMFKGEEVPFIRTTFTLKFADGSTEDKELLFVPHHGAVREMDAAAGTALTLRWTGNDLDSDVDVFTDLVRAQNLEEARGALSKITGFGQNVVVIDSENNIGWYPYNRLPKRTWATDLAGGAPSWLPLDGACATAETCYEWDEYFTLEELPQATNPASGYIATANNDMTGALFDEDPTTLPGDRPHPPYQVDSAAGFRHAQIVRLIEGIGDQHSRASMDAIVSDIHSLIGERMIPKMLEIATHEDTTPGLNGLKVISALENWDFSCPTGLNGIDSENSPLVTDAAVLLSSSGCAAFHAMVIELRARIEANENAPDGRSPSLAMYHSIVDPTQLIGGDVYWDDPGTSAVETKHEVMSDALQAAGDFLDGQLGADETSWAWGRLHGLVLSSDLDTFGIASYNNPAPGDPLFANDGGLFTVDVANPGQTDFVQTAGPSTRFVCEASPTGPSCTFQLPGGQSADINSEHYEDLLPGFLSNEPIPLVFDIEEAAANAVQTVIFQ